MKNYLIAIAMSAAFLGIGGCDDRRPTSDDIQHNQQEKLLQEATAQSGMPNVKNFRERKMMKEIIELRDQEGLVTYTYVWSELNGRFVYLGETIGYGLPYSTQYTNPQKIEKSGVNYGYAIMDQADPNGLFSPQSAEGTWILMKDPHGKAVKPVYIEPRILVSPFKLDDAVIETASAAATK